MRVSIDKADPGYETYLGIHANGRDCKVFLNGEQQRWVVTADDVEGIVTCHDSDTDGNLVIDGDEVATVTRKGDVVIETYIP